MTSDLKVATKPCGKNIFAVRKLCGLCLKQLAALCIFLRQKKSSLYLYVFVFKKIKNSVTP